MEGMEATREEKVMIRLFNLLPEAMHAVDSTGIHLPMVKKKLNPFSVDEDEGDTDTSVLEPHEEPKDATGHFVGRGGGITSTGVGQRSQGAGDVGGDGSGRKAGKGGQRMGYTINMEPGAETDDSELKGSGKEPSVSNITV